MNVWLYVAASPFVFCLRHDTRVDGLWMPEWMRQGFHTQIARDRLRVALQLAWSSAGSLDDGSPVDFSILQRKSDMAAMLHMLHDVFSDAASATFRAHSRSTACSITGLCYRQRRDYRSLMCRTPPPCRVLSQGASGWRLKTTAWHSVKSTCRTSASPTLLPSTPARCKSSPAETVSTAKHNYRISVALPGLQHLRGCKR